MPKDKDTDLSADMSAVIDTDDTREEREICRIGEEALVVLKQTFETWMLVARALDIGRQKAMIATGADDVQDRTYQKAFGRWLDRHPKFADKEMLPDSTRSWLLRCYDHQSEIMHWRRQQGAMEMVKYNYPETVFIRWARKEAPDLLTEAQREGRSSKGKKRPSEEQKKRSLAATPTKMQQQVLDDFREKDPVTRGEQLAELSDEEREALFKLLPAAEHAEWQVEWAAAVNAQALAEREMVAAAAQDHLAANARAEVHPRGATATTTQRAATLDQSAETASSTSSRRVSEPMWVQKFNALSASGAFSGRNNSPEVREQLNDVLNDIAQNLANEFEDLESDLEDAKQDLEELQVENDRLKQLLADKPCVNKDELEKLHPIADGILAEAKKPSVRVSTGKILVLGGDLAELLKKWGVPQPKTARRQTEAKPEQPEPVAETADTSETTTPGTALAPAQVTLDKHGNLPLPDRLPPLMELPPERPRPKRRTKPGADQ
jgi:hypothetical protein